MPVENFFELSTSYLHFSDFKVALGKFSCDITLFGARLPIFAKTA